MLKAPIVGSDKERLKKLKDYSILDTEKEDIFEELTIIAASICNTKIAAISFFDRDRQWFKSIQGLELTEIPSDSSFCSYTIVEDKVFIVEDSQDDIRFCNNPMYLDKQHIRFYAGVPLVSPEGFRIGSLCVIDTEGKTLTELQKKILISLSKQVMSYLELKLKSKELKTIQKQFDEVQYISKTGHWELDVKTNLTRWSKEVYAIYGLEPGTPLHKIDAMSFYVEHDRIRLLKILENSIKNKKKFVGDFEFIDDKGNHKWVRSSGYPFFDEDQNVTQLVGTFQDVTNIKNVAIKEKTIFEQSFDSIMILEPPFWKFSSINPAAMKLFKFSNEKLYNSLGPWDISPGYQPDGVLSSEKFKQYIDKAIKDGRVSFDWEHLDLEGSKIYCTVLLSRLTIDSKNILQATIRDNTNIKEQERDTQYILESMKVGTWKWDIIKNELIWDDSNYKVFNIDKNNFSSAYEAWERTLHPDYKDEVVQELEHALVNSNEYVATFPILLESKVIRYIGAKANIFRNDEGEAIQMIGINWDNTHEYKITQELEKEKKHSYHSSKLASLGELAAGVGHEINNPIAIISGHSSIISRLLDKGELDQIPNSLSIMNNAVKRVTKIVKSLKTFSRADSAENEHFSFSSVVHETAEMIRDIYLKEGIEITIEVTGECIVWGNRGRIQQVLVNLMSNSRDALKNVDVKTIKIKVKVTKRKYRVSVTDSGEGIPESIIDKIFDPFYTSKEVNEGTGIGLSLCHRIISEHDGKLLVETKVGHGTTFKFDLNKVASHVKVTTMPVEKIELVEKKMRGSILIVDDEDDVRKLLEIFIKEIGFSCDSACNGEEALRLYLNNKDKYDYVISDMQMPTMDGVALFKEIRSRKSLKLPKLLIVTGGVNVNFEDKNSKIGKLIDGHFVKPFTIDTIRKKLKELED